MAKQQNGLLDEALVEDFKKKHGDLLKITVKRGSDTPFVALIKKDISFHVMARALMLIRKDDAAQAGELIYNHAKVWESERDFANDPKVKLSAVVSALDALEFAESFTESA